MSRATLMTTGRSDDHGRRTLETSDLSLASFLRCRSFPLLALRRDGGRTVFVFEDSDGLQQAIVDFANDAPVGVRSFSNTLRDLKGLTR